jgi:hypothetical protein
MITSIIIHDSENLARFVRAPEIEHTAGTQHVSKDKHLLREAPLCD